jgi:hypothetical protein
LPTSCAATRHDFSLETVLADHHLMEDLLQEEIYAKMGIFQNELCTIANILVSANLGFGLC